MEISLKSIRNVAVAGFGLFLVVYYWEAVSGFVAGFLSAAYPVVLGAIMAYVVNVLMDFYEKHYFPRSRATWVTRTRRGVCLVAALLTILLVLAAVVALVIPQLVSAIAVLLQGIPSLVDQILSNPTVLRYMPEDIVHEAGTIDWEALLEQVTDWAMSGLGSNASTIATRVTTAFSSVASVVLGIVFSLYFLAGKEKVLAACNRLMHRYLPTAWAGRVKYVLSCLNESMHNFIVGQCLEAAILGVLCFVGMSVLRLPYAPMVSALVGVTAIIPILGAYLALIVGAFMILSVSPVQALVFVGFFLILQQLEGNLIYSRVVGNMISTPGVLVLAAVTVGGSLFGIPGILVGVPLMSAVCRMVGDDLRAHGEGAEAAEEAMEEETSSDVPEEPEHSEQPGESERPA